MNKENILYGIIGLLVGLIIGYSGTNYINRSYSPPSSREQAEANTGNQPANHPPAAESQGGPQGDVVAVIQQARNKPSNYQAQIQAASMFQQINRHEQALEFLDRAYKIRPNDFILLVNLGNTNFDLKRFDEAERWYQMALKINQSDAMARMLLGLTYYLRQPRDLDRAITEYRKALSYDSRHEKTLENLTIALIDKGDKKAARETLKQLEQVNPDNQTIAQIRDRLKE